MSTDAVLYQLQLYQTCLLSQVHSDDTNMNVILTENDIALHGDIPLGLKEVDNNTLSADAALYQLQLYHACLLSQVQQCTILY